MKLTRKHVIGYAATGVIALALGAATGGTPTTIAAAPTPAVTVTAPAPAAETVSVPGKAPAECGEALDMAGEFAKAVATEHSEMGAAFGQAANDGDMSAMADGVGAALRKVTSKMESLTGPMGVASAACRAGL